MAICRKTNGKPTREPYQKKRIINRKSMRGQPETDYGELKKIASFSLTPTGINLLKLISKKLGISTSEFLERIAREKYQLVDDAQLEKVD